MPLWSSRHAAPAILPTAWMTRPSTAVRMSLDGRPGTAQTLSSPPESSSTTFLRSALSKTVDATDRLPKEARDTPSFFCTFFSSLTCCNARSEVQMGLNMYSSNRETFWSMCRIRLPALSPAQPASCKPSRRSDNARKYFSPWTWCALIFSRLRRPMMPVIHKILESASLLYGFFQKNLKKLSRSPGARRRLPPPEASSQTHSNNRAEHYWRSEE